MTQGKNPRSFKKKGTKKKVAHPFAKKEWYNVVVPSMFEVRTPTLTPVNKTAGQKNSADSLRGRVFEINLADMKREGQKDSFRKMKVIIEEIKGSDCYTNFYGMDITREKLCTIVKKWHSIIEVVVQVKSQDGYLMRISCIGFTKRTSRQVKATCYAKNSQSKLIRKKITEILLNEAAKNSLRDLTKLFIQEKLTTQITKECGKIFPLENVLIRKVKILKRPKFDLNKLMENYKEKPEDKKQEGAAEGDAKNLLAGK